MERMRGIDAGYLYMETPTVHMHTLKVGVLDPSSVPGGYTFERFKDELGARLHLLPPFRRRIVPVPLGLHHPLWVDDPDFDLDRHVHRVTVGGSGSMRDLDAVVGRIAGEPLPRDRPLWDVTVVEGLAEGRIAAVAKMHHAVADGVASAALLANVSTTSPEDRHASAAPPWTGEPLPTSGELVAGAVRDWFRDLRGLPALLADTARRLGNVAGHRRVADPRPPRPVLDTPRAPFSGAPDARRQFATVALDFDDFRAVRKVTGAAFNDVVMAVIDGAIVRWLGDQGLRLDRPLLAAVPVSADDTGHVRLSGNRVSSLLTSLASDVTDPVERLRRVSAVADQAKVIQQMLGVDMLERWVQFTPPGLFAGVMRLYSRLRLSDRHPPPVNLVISNVPGPREPLYIAGAELLDFFSVGPVLEGMPLNVTAWSYRGRMCFAILASPRTCHDVHALAAALADSLAELVAATGAYGMPRSTQTPSPPT